MNDLIDIGPTDPIDVLLPNADPELYFWERPIESHKPGPRKPSPIERLWNGRAFREPSRLITNPKYLD